MSLTWPTVKQAGRGLSLLMILLLPALGSYGASAAGDSAGIWSLSLENSSITPTSPSDRNYTNGLGLDWTSAPGVLPAPLAALSQTLWGAGKDRMSLGIFQQIFTPDDTQANPPSPYERPYAGYLALHLGLINDQASTESMLAVDLGAVGPIALGEEIQNGFHRLIGQATDKGWGYQLHDEPTLELSGGRTWRVALGGIGGLAIDVLPAVSLGAGNVMDYGQAGAVFRIGTHLDADFGPGRLPPGLEGSPVFVPHPLVWYFFAGADGQAVAHDLFLNGNTFSSSPHVTPNPLVGEFEAGIAIIFQGLRLSYIQVFQTRSWHGQKGAIFSFGALQASVRF